MTINDTDWQHDSDLYSLVHTHIHSVWQRMYPVSGFLFVCVCVRELHHMHWSVSMCAVGILILT